MQIRIAAGCLEYIDDSGRVRSRYDLPEPCYTVPVRPNMVVEDLMRLTTLYDARDGVEEAFTDLLRAYHNGAIFGYQAICQAVQLAEEHRVPGHRIESTVRQLNRVHTV